ncbi:MAG: hypothetical protein H6Q64_2403 [Firmicutes bacterium]|nr:hypothetical protein [Bacillota bacterium]
MSDKIKIVMIAPCGLNCATCLSQFKSTITCGGCNNNNHHKPEYCSRCIIKNCEKRIINKYKYCFQCDTFPCRRLKQLDKRYSTKYHMSLLVNLNDIKMNGIRNYIKREKGKWICSKCGYLLCVHREYCLNCGEKKRNINKL